jgi:hypothetical protein
MLFSALVLAATAAASPVVQRQVTTEFAPWNITDLFSYKPSGQPSPNTNRRIALRITDPNEIKLMRASRFGFAVFPALTVDCDIQWEFPAGLPPYGEEILCPTSGDGSSGNFTVALVEGTGELETVLDFGLKFKETREVNVHQYYFKRVFEGTVSFKAGQNYQGSCGESGVCAGQLIDDVAVTQELTESVGSCEEYGGCT